MNYKNDLITKLQTISKMFRVKFNSKATGLLKKY